MSQPMTDRVQVLADLQKALGYQFKQTGTLEHALVHRSYSHESSSSGDPVPHNEPLEFLGDAVLGFVVAEGIYRQRPELDEGAMTRLRAALVNTRRLAREATSMGIDAAVLLGRGEEASGGRTKPSLLADTMEAVIGAMLLDGGVEAVQALISAIFGEEIRQRRASAMDSLDPKTKLQEWLQARGKPLPEYALVESRGPDHAREFVIEAMVEGKPLGRGSGPSKKRAEQDAASQAMARLKGTS